MAVSAAVVLVVEAAAVAVEAVSAAAAPAGVKAAAVAVVRAVGPWTAGGEVDSAVVDAALAVCWGFRGDLS